VTGDVEHDAQDVFEAEEVRVDEEVHRDRYDDLDDEYDLPKDFEDEEIDEDEAFNSEDERMYGHLFEGDGGKYSDYDSEEDEDRYEGDVGGPGPGDDDDDDDDDDGIRDVFDALMSDEEEEEEEEEEEKEEEEEEEAAWPEDISGGGDFRFRLSGEDGNRGDDNGGDGGKGSREEEAQYDSEDFFDGQSEDETADEDLSNRVGKRRDEGIEMIRELNPESIYAVSGQGTIAQ
jgi:U3 small nucleolar RNA-associated protein 14